MKDCPRCCKQERRPCKNRCFHQKTRAKICTELLKNRAKEHENTIRCRATPCIHSSWASFLLKSLEKVRLNTCLNDMYALMWQHLDTSYRHTTAKLPDCTQLYPVCWPSDKREIILRCESSRLLLMHELHASAPDR